MEESPDLVLQCDPRPPLPTITEAAAKAQSSQGKHPSQCATVGCTDDAGSGQHQAGVGRGNRRCRRLPAFTNFGQEAGPRRRILGEFLVAAVAIEADCRGRHYDGRWATKTGQCSGQYFSSLYAAVKNPPLLGCRPPAIDSLTSQVDDGVDTLEGRLVDPTSSQIPGHATSGWASTDGDNPVSALLQSGRQGGSDQPRGAGYRDRTHANFLLVDATPADGQSANLYDSMCGVYQIATTNLESRGAN